MALRRENDETSSVYEKRQRVGWGEVVLSGDDHCPFSSAFSPLLNPLFKSSNHVYMLQYVAHSSLCTQPL